MRDCSHSVFSSVLSGIVVYVLVFCFLSAGVTNVDAAPEVLTFHPVPKVDNPPELDGKLDDNVWNEVPEYSTFYYFWNWTPPKPVGTDTSIWLAYTEEGLYLAIANYRENMSNLKADVTTRDDGDIWKDSSNEIYIDSTGTAISYRKFVINSLGTKYDQYQLDAANRFDSWTKNTWKLVTSRDDDGWYAELFFPFDILGDIGRPGDTWRFAVNRFPQTGGSHASSAPGARYSKPSNFGWLYFLQGTEIDPNRLAEEIAGKISGNWFLPFGDKLLVKRNDELEVTTMEKELKKLKQEVDQQVRETRNRVPEGSKEKKKLQKLVKKLKKLNFDVNDAARFSQTIGKLNSLQRDIENLLYSVKTRQLIENTVQK